MLTKSLPVTSPLLLTIVPRLSLTAATSGRLAVTTTSDFTLVVDTGAVPALTVRVANAVTPSVTIDAGSVFAIIQL